MDGAKAKHIVNANVLEAIASQTNLTIDFGGGIKTDKDIQIAFEAGASQITAGSIAVNNPDLVKNWIARYGADKIILGADVKNGGIAINGWQDTSQLDLMPFLQRYMENGIQNCICTDVSKDGLLQGSAVELYRSILRQFPNLNLVASGGVNSIQELKQLSEVGCAGAIIGKAIYEGKITLNELTKEMILC